MALTEENRDELEGMLWELQKAKALGYSRVTHNGRTVEYRSMAEMRQAEADLKRMLGETPPRRTFVAFSRNGV